MTRSRNWLAHGIGQGLTFGMILAGFVSPLSGAGPDIESSLATVERIRGHRFAGAVEHRSLSRKDLRNILEQQLERDLELPFDDYMTVVQSLYLVSGVENPMSELLDLFDAQVLAFYDPVDNVYYSIDEPPDGMPMVDVMERAVVVHELTHALQDQVFGAGDDMEEMRGRWDREIAYHALIEGEATLVMMEALMEPMGMSLGDLARQGGLEETLMNAASIDNLVPTDAPRYFVEMLTFPYLEGLRFLLEAYNEGGWSRIDEIWSNPPSTSEQILNPAGFMSRGELFEPLVLADSLKPLEAASSSGRIAGEAFEFGVSLGEFHWRFLLGESAARGWGGDWTSVLVDENGSTTVLVDSMWDSELDAIEFEEAYAEFLLSHEAPDASVMRNGSSVRVAYGSDPEVIGEFMARAKPPLEERSK